MTADKTDGGAVPPTTHYAIHACCLICAHAAHTSTYNTLCTGGKYRGWSQSIMKQGCDDFILRDFGYPVRKVELE